MRPSASGTSSATAKSDSRPVASSARFTMREPGTTSSWPPARRPRPSPRRARPARPSRGTRPRRGPPPASGRGCCSASRAASRGAVSVSSLADDVQHPGAGPWSTTSNRMTSPRSDPSPGSRSVPFMPARSSKGGPVLVRDPAPRPRRHPTEAVPAGNKAPLRRVRAGGKERAPTRDRRADRLATAGGVDGGPGLDRPWRPGWRSDVRPPVRRDGPVRAPPRACPTWWSTGCARPRVRRARPARGRPPCGGGFVA